MRKFNLFTFAVLFLLISRGVSNATCSGACVQETAVAVGTSGADPAPAFASNSTTGNMVLYIASQTVGTSPLTPSGMGTTWVTVIDTAGNGASGSRAWVFCTVVTTPGKTVTLSGMNSTTHGQLVEYNSPKACNPIGTNVIKSATTGTSTTPGTLTMLGTGDLTIFTATHRSAEAVTDSAGAGFVALNLNATSSTSNSDYQTSTGALSVNPSASWTTSVSNASGVSALTNACLNNDACVQMSQVVLSTASANNVTTLPANATVGNIIVGFYALSQGTATATPVPSSTASAWVTEVDTGGSGAAGSRLYAFCAVVTTAGTTVSTAISAASASGQIAEFTGYSCAGNGSQVAHNSSSTSVTPANLTTTVATTLVLAFAAHKTSEAVVDGSTGFTQQMVVNPTTSTLNVDYAIRTTTGTVTGSWSWATASANAGAVFALIKGGNGLVAYSEDDTSYANTIPLATIYVDNTDPGWTSTGAWATATTNRLYYGTNYTTTAAGSGATANWAFPATGPAALYDVYVRWTSGVTNVSDTTMTSAAVYTVTYSGAATKVRTMTQQWTTGVWVYLGTFAFDTVGAQGVGVVASADGKVSADVVKFVPTFYPATPNTHGRVQIAANGRTFKYADGTVLPVIGINYPLLNTPDPTPGPSESLFQTFVAYGINLVRSFGFSTDIQQGYHASGGVLTPGSFDMVQAQTYQDLFMLGEKYNVWIQPQMGYGNAAQNNDPYNPVQGGPTNITNDLQCWPPSMNTATTELWQDRMWDFLTNQYGINTTSVHSWSVGNDFTQSTCGIAMITAAETEIKSQDSGALVYYQIGGAHSSNTASGYQPGGAAVIDFLSSRVYGWGTQTVAPFGDCADVPNCDVSNPGMDGEDWAVVANGRAENQQITYNKLTVFGEGGFGPQYQPQNDNEYEKITQYFMWSGFAGGAQVPWIWTVYHSHASAGTITLSVPLTSYWPILLNCYKVISTAIATYLGSGQLNTSLRATFSIDTGDINTYGTWYGTTLFAWLMHLDNVLDSTLVNVNHVSPWTNSSVSGNLTVTNNITPGSYDVTILNPRTGAVLSTSTIATATTSLVIPTGSFANSIGIIVKPH